MLILLSKMDETKGKKTWIYLWLLANNQQNEFQAFAKQKSQAFLKILSVLNFTGLVAIGLISL